MNWQPIKTAPRDGSEVLLFADVGLGSGIYVGYYDPIAAGGYVGPYGAFVWRGAPADTESRAVAESLVTHWKPLPAPPKLRKKRAAKPLKES